LNRTLIRQINLISLTDLNTI